MHQFSDLLKNTPPLQFESTLDNLNCESLTCKAKVDAARGEASHSARGDDTDSFDFEQFYSTLLPLPRSQRARLLESLPEWRQLQVEEFLRNKHLEKNGG